MRDSLPRLLTNILASVNRPQILFFLTEASDASLSTLGSNLANCRLKLADLGMFILEMSQMADRASMKI
jgi:hypothetical protein